ncbi:hypothetical protein BY458DRAFT_583749 [Sporodiniella umbellata]|nr:hypothetical protein BY458DRAFT_583749 [Sporodiniella umbellata]
MSNNLTINTQNKKSEEAKGFIEEEEEEEESDYSSSPSIPDENINFDLVYTLHTFEATVEGQASVKKGDALTLLDDSNSYWWLIKDLKTSEVGYIPAENIETPFERLARLNKHRNVEITSLGHAAHYIKDKRKLRRKKKVVLLPSVHVQLQVIFSGENGEDSNETTYETWEEDMIDHEKLDAQSEQETEEEESEEEESEEEESEEEESEEPIQRPNETTLHPPKEPTFQVLRVHAGNISVGASYQSIRVTENISAAELLSKAMEKFHIPEIDRHDKRKTNSVEYYLSIRNREGEEITIGPEDKPYKIYESLNAYLTTPMPRLSDQLKLSNTLKKRKKRHDVQFLLHKRIKRTNEGGLVHIKLSLLAQKSTIEKVNSFQSWLMKKKRKASASPSTLEAERMDKLIAVHDTITVAELVLIAFEKFHIVPQKSHNYRLLLHTKNRDILLKEELILSTVLQGLNHHEEKQFILHNFNSVPATPQNHNRVFPETKQPIQVTMTVDRATQTLLKRVDDALSQHNTKKPNEPANNFTMSVSRNESQGIDIYIPHGLLRSSRLGQNKVQYSLLTDPNETPILQKVLPEATSQPDGNCCILTGEEMESLIRYGSHYLDNLETKYNHRLSITNGKAIDFSNMSDLEKVNTSFSSQTLTLSL